jgi:hypothetical protein
MQLSSSSNMQALPACDVSVVNAELLRSNAAKITIIELGSAMVSRREGPR